MVGNLLFMIHTCSRFADVQRIREEPTTGQGWIQAHVVEYKTSKARSRRGRTLPILGFSKGLIGDWGMEYLRVRKDMKVKASTARPFMPDVVENSVMASGWSLASATSYIRFHLMKAWESGDVPEVKPTEFATHSCKRTLMHWCAVSGLDLDTRRLLGHHT
eukprot:1593943-Amphidinium_carterae.1